MDTVIRNVDQIDAHDRQSLEHVLGLSLRENQQLVINIVDLKIHVETVAAPTISTPNGQPTLPIWCNVYEGLSDDEITAVEQTILRRADLSRSTE
jgi:multidrug efflux pump subunit AcrB